MVLLVSFSKDVHATHIVGGDITYKHIEGNVYEVTLTFRRDCINGADDAQFDDPARVAIYTGQGQLAIWLGRAGVLEMNLSDSDTLNTTIISDCGFIGNQVCVQETKYVSRVMLPFRPDGYHLSYQRCCRNITLNNIVEPLNTGGTYTVFVTPESLELKNSAPSFNQWADIYICANEPLNFDHSATDAEGDSLVYKLCVPFSGATEALPRPLAPPPPYDTVIWQDPYSSNDPLGGIPLMIDPETGQLTGTPNIIGQFLVGLCVEEYRNGQLLSTVRRDFQYNVRSCSGVPMASFTVEQPVCNFTPIIENQSTNTDQYEWSIVDENGDTTLVSNDVDPGFRFDSPGLYTIVLKATRSADGCFDVTSRRVEVLNSDLIADFILSIESCTNDGFVINAMSTSLDNVADNEITSYLWEVTTDDITETFTTENISVITVSGEGNISLTVESENGCSAILQKEFEAGDLIPDASFDAQVLSCDENGMFNISLTDNTISQSPINSYSWNVTINNEVTSFSGPSVEFIVNENSQVSVEYMVVFENGCSSMTTQDLDLKSLLPDAEIDFQVTSCNDDGSVNVTLIDKSAGENKISQDWEITINTEVEIFSGPTVEIEVPADGEIQVKLIVTYENGCEVEVEKGYAIQELLPKVDFSFTAESCTANGLINVLLTNISDDIEDIETSEWKVTIDGEEVSFSGLNVILSGLSPETEIAVTLDITYTSNCSGSLTKTFKAEDALPQAQFITSVSQCNEDGSVDIAIENSSTQSENIESIVFSIRRNGEVSTFTNSPIQLTNVGLDETIIVNLEVMYNNGCMASTQDSVSISDILPKAQFLITLENCNETEGELNILISDISSGGNVISRMFTINVNGELISSDESEIALTVNESDLINIDLSVVFDNGCTASISEDVDLDSLIPIPIIGFDVLSCNEDGSALVLFSNESTGNEIANQQWEITIDGELTVLTGESLEIEIPDNNDINIKLSVEYTNGCLAEIDETYSLEDLLPSADFIFSAESCTANGLINIVLTNTSDNIDRIDNAEWTVIIDGETLSFTGMNVILPSLDPETIVDVTLDVTYENNCSSSLNNSFTAKDALPKADFMTTVSQCNEDGTVNILISNNSSQSENIENISFIITRNGEELTFNSSPVELNNINVEEIINIVLQVNYNNGCSASITKDVNIGDILPSAEFLAQVTKCNEDGSFEVTISDESSGGNVMDRTFTIELNGEMFTSNDASVTFTVNETDSINVILDVQFDNGCSDQIEEIISVQDILPSANYNALILACKANGLVDIEISNSSNFEGEARWEIVVAGSTMMFIGDTIILTDVDLDTEVTVNLFVEGGSSGCSNSITDTFTPRDILPMATYDSELISCASENEITVKLSNSSTNPFTETQWLVENNGIVITSDQTMLEVTIDPTVPALVTLEVDFENGCSDILMDTLNIMDLLPLPTFSEETIECELPDSVTVKFSENTVVSQATIGWEWEITIDGEVTTYDTKMVTITIPREGSINVSLTVTLDNGCVLKVEDLEYEAGPFAEIDFFGNGRISGCPGDTVSLVNNPNPEFTYTWSPENILIFDDAGNSNPKVIVTNDDQEIKVVVSDGACVDSSSVIVGVDSSSLIVFVGDSVTCDGKATLVARPGTGDGSIEWSESREFVNVISTNDTLLIDDEDENTYYVRVNGGSCEGVIDSITVFNRSIDIFELPFEICQGDTTTLRVVNLDPTQDIIFVFQPDPHIVDDDSTGMPIIGIGQEETDSFYLYYFAENQFGCSINDSIMIKIVDNPMVTFTPTLEDCGAFTVCFSPDVEINGVPVWDFGDPESGNENNSFMLEPCHTYPGPGDYEITLRSISTFCAAMPVMQSITLTEDFSLDTISSQTACVGDTIVFTSGASVEGLNYVWCSVNGDTLAVGDTFNYIAMEGGVDVILKGFDFFECSDTTMFSVNVVDFNFDYNVPDIACAGDETQIDVLGTNGRNLQFSWTPISAITSGADSNSPIFNISEDTEVMVNIIDLDSGCTFDSSFVLAVIEINASITADPDSEINEGESVDLEVNSDADVTMYDWDDPNLNGQNVTVTPGETTTYTVTVTDANGCTAEASITISVRNAVCDENDVYIPNAFTPNNDGVNDVFRVRSNFIDIMELVVYNRWGQEIFRTTNPESGWDGTFNGDELPPDAYGYQLTVTCINDVTYITKGNVSLLR